MASNALPDVPYKSQMLDPRGFVSLPWQAFFRELFNRVGKNIAPSNSDLEDIVIDGVDGIISDVTTLQSQMILLQARVAQVEGGLTVGRQL